MSSGENLEERGGADNADIKRNAEDLFTRDEYESSRSEWARISNPRLAGLSERDLMRVKAERRRYKSCVYAETQRQKRIRSSEMKDNEIESLKKELQELKSQIGALTAAADKCSSMSAAAEQASTGQN